MSGVTGHAQGIGEAHDDCRSLPVYMAITPAIFNAAETSIDLIFACANGERKTERCNAPGIFKSFVNFASPVSSGGSSRRSNLVPITEVGLFSVIVMIDPFTLRSRRRAQT